MYILQYPKSYWPFLETSMEFYRQRRPQFDVAKGYNIPDQQESLFAAGAIKFAFSQTLQG